jgi:hypothetical protein
MQIRKAGKISLAEVARLVVIASPNATIGDKCFPFPRAYF